MFSLGEIEILVYSPLRERERELAESWKRENRGWVDLDRGLLLFGAHFCTLEEGANEEKQFAFNSTPLESWPSCHIERSHTQQRPGWTGCQVTPASLHMKWPSVSVGDSCVACEWQAEPMSLLRLVIQIQHKELTENVTGVMYRCLPLIQLGDCNYTQQLYKYLTFFRLPNGTAAGIIKQMCAWERNGLQQLSMFQGRGLKKSLILFFVFFVFCISIHVIISECCSLRRS